MNKVNTALSFSAWLLFQLVLRLQVLESREGQKASEGVLQPPHPPEAFPADPGLHPLTAGPRTTPASRVGGPGCLSGHILQWPGPAHEGGGHVQVLFACVCRELQVAS
ncbi:uncharacterized protein LOC128966724 [Homo sapiens]|uniref:uncharacterized protein LOC128966724 n=1 Tax=Homo sapiens TaxID=9606 RepID=UPI0023DEDFE1|nr:uncharacterized protein LOC128966724 [Homo sapiens]